MPDSDHAIDPELLLQNAGWLRGLARQLVTDDAAAEDVVQETWLAALASPPRATGDGPGLRAWLARVARNVAFMQRRSAGRRERRETAAARVDTSPAAVETATRIETHRRLLAAVETLDEPYRTVIRMRWFDGLAPREIAVRLDLAPHIVWTRLSRAHARLRELLQEQQGGRRGMLVLLAGVTGREVGAAAGTLAGGGAVAAGVAAAAKGGLMAISGKTVLGGAAIAAALLVAWVLYPDAADTPPPGAPDETAVVPTDGEPVRRPGRVTVAPPPAADGDATLEATPSDGAKPVAVRVVDAVTREPVDGAQVRVGYRDLSAMTGYEFVGSAGDGDAVGTWDSFDLREDAYPRSLLQGGDVFVHIAADGFALHIDAARPFSPTDEQIDLGEIALARGITISGRVTSGRTGRAIAGAPLFVTPPVPRWVSAALSRFVPAGTSGEDGTFTLSHPAVPCETSQSIVIAALTEEGLGVRQIFPTGVDDIDDADVVVRTAPLTVNVRAPDGEPVGGAIVGLGFRDAPFRAGPLVGRRVWAGPHAEIRDVVETTTGDDGVAHLTRLPLFLNETRVDIIADAPGYASAVELDVHVDPEGRTVDIVLRPDGEHAIVGRVVDEAGAGVPGAHVRFVDPSSTPRGAVATSAADGSFRMIGELFKGEWELEARASHDRAGRTAVHVSPDGVVDAGDIVVRRTAPITGRVVDPEGKPVAKLPVRAFARGENHSTLTDADGRFVIDGAQHGEWNLEVLTRLFGVQLRAGRMSTGRFADEPMQLVRGGDDIQVTLRRPPSGEARIVVEGVDGATNVKIAVEHRAVMLIAVDPALRHGGIEITSPRGRAVIDRVPAGRWQVWARADGYVPTFTTVTVEPGVGEVQARLTFGKGGAIEGTIDTSGVEHFRNVVVIANLVGQRSLPGGSEWWHRPPNGHTRTSMLVKDAKFAFDLLPPGRWRLRLIGPGIVGSSEVDVTHSGVSNVVVHAEQGGILRFRGDAVVAPGQALVAVARPGEDWQERTGGMSEGDAPFTAALTLEPGLWRWRVRFPTDRGKCLTTAAETQEGEIDLAAGGDVEVVVPVTAR